MRIIKVDAIDSTNSFVRKFYEGKNDFKPVCVRAIDQTSGRGQRGAQWKSKPGQNLTFSILYPQNQLDISRHFHLSISVSLAVLAGLKKLNIPDLKVKWPNDIMSSKKKVGGILIENIVKTEGIVASVIGIGLNVNQQDFEDLPSATSLSLVSKRKFDIDEILNLLIHEIEKSFERLSGVSEDQLLRDYKKELFRIDKVSVFKTPEEETFNGIIRGVSMQGLLQVEREGDLLEEYDLKEIQLLY